MNVDFVCRSLQGPCKVVEGDHATTRGIPARELILAIPHLPIGFFLITINYLVVSFLFFFVWLFLWPPAWTPARVYGM